MTAARVDGDWIHLDGPAGSVRMGNDPGTLLIAREVWDHDCYGLAGTIAGATLVDIGANVGVTALAAIAHGAAHVIAVEPDAINFAQLQRNLAASGVGDRVEVHHAAVGRPGRAQVHRPPRHPATCCGSSWTTPQLEDGAATVAQHHLEHYLGHGHDLVVKIDTEGGEYEALAGAGIDVLAARAARLVLEWHHFPDRGIDAYEQLPPLLMRLLRRYDVAVTGAPERGGLLAAARRAA